jgi:flagellar FliL protein
MSASPAPEAAAAPKKSKKKLVVLALAGLLLAGGSAAGAWYYASAKGPAAESAEPLPKPLPKANFTNLEPFTVNLQDPRGERFAQIGVTLELDDPKSENEIKDRMPAIRNNILMLISSKQIDELLSAEGKAHLALEIRDQAGRALGLPPAPPPPLAAALEAAPQATAASAAPAASAAKPARNVRPNPIRGVLFSQFIVQ